MAKKKKVTKALLINPVTKAITEVLVDGLDSMYAHLSSQEGYKVDLVTTVQIDETNTVFVDDEGLLKSPQHFVIWKGDNTLPLAGMGLVCGVDEEGETVDVSIKAEDILKIIEFSTAADVALRSKLGEF